MYDYICWISSDQVRSPATKLAIPTTKQPRRFSHQVIQEEEAKTPRRLHEHQITTTSQGGA